MQKFPFRQHQLLSISPEFLIIIISFTAGICWANTFVLDGQIVLSAIFLLLVLIFVFYQFKGKWHFITFYSLFGLLLFLTGYSNAQNHLAPPANPNHIFNQIKENQTVSLYGTLAELPSSLSLPSGIKTRLLMQVKALHQDSRMGEVEKHRKTSGLILLTLKGLIPDKLLPGDHFLVKAKISYVSSFSTPGSFNYKKHLANQSIFLKGWVDSPHNIIKVRTGNPSIYDLEIASLLYFPERIRHHISNFLDETLSQPSRGLYKAILIGDRSDISRSVLENFINGGCIHILAISGMHMGLLAFMTITVFTSILKCSTWLLLNIDVRKTAVSFALLPLIAYALIAGFNIPVLRALLMTAILVVAIIFDRPENLINHILLAAFLILAWKPTALFTASFQLSFSAVVSIALIYPLLCHLLSKNPSYSSMTTISEYDPVSKFLPPESRFVLPTILLKWLLAGISLTTAAMLGTLPLLLFHFNRISLVGPFTNLLVEPLICFWSLIVGIVASLFIPFAPTLAKFLFNVGSIGLIIAEKICAYFSTLPYVSLRLPTPSLMEIILFYTFIFSIVMSFHLGTNRKRFCLIIALISFCCLLATPVLSKISRQASISTSVSFLDVGHGSSTLLQLPHNKNILIDGGGAGSENFNIGERIIGPFLWKNKLKHIDIVIISHPHADHYNGLEFILKHFHPKELWINGMTGHDPGYQKLLQLANKLNIAIKVPHTGEIIFQNGNARLQCVNNGFWAHHISNKKIFPQTKLVDTNDMSLILRLDTIGGSFLFPADISATMANTLVSKRKNLQADILLAPHHGSRSSMSLDFIQAVAPKYIAISAGRNNPFNFPDKSFFDLQHKGISVLTTGRDGTLSFTVAGEEIMISRYQIN